MLGAVCVLLSLSAMEPLSHTAKADPTAGRTIPFTCVHCGTSFDVAATAAGGPLACRNCGKVSIVPQPDLEVAAGAALQISQLQHQLKENESQRTEVTGYINQLNIQVHRWQLRLQSLNERQAKLRLELEQHLPRGGAA